MAVEVVRLIEGVAGGLEVGCSRAAARLWPEPVTTVAPFPDGEDEDIRYICGGVCGSMVRGRVIFYFRYDTPK